MRTQLFGRVALLGAVALVCGTGSARAQTGSGYPPNGYPQANVSDAQAVPASYWGQRYCAGCANPAWYNPYYQGYGYYNNYYYYYPYYSNGYQGYSPNQYPQQYPSGTSFPSAGTADTLPGLPLTADEVGAEEAPAKKGDLGPAAPVHKDRFWFSGGYDASFIKPWHLNTPLVTNGSMNDAHPGALGQPGTVVVRGDSADFGLFNGVRLGAGVYLDSDARLSLEWVGQYAIANHVRFVQGSDAGGNPIITRPDFDVVNGIERAFFDTFPGVATGGVTVDAKSQFMGTELNGRYEFRPASHFSVDALLGFRFMRLTESLTIRDQVEPLVPGVVTFQGPGVDPGSALADFDSFRTSNHFYGLQLGSSVLWEGKWLFARAFGKVAIGATDQEVDINGGTSLFTGSGVTSTVGGILAQQTNIGQHTRTELGFVPEGGLTVGVKVAPWMRLTAGYSFLYWNAVVRPGAQIDRGLNPTLIPSDSTFVPGVTSPLRPAFRFNDESYWVHTLTVGVDLHY